MSAAILDSQKLYGWCKAIIASIDKERQRLCNELVDAEIKREARSRWWRRGRVITREQAIENLEAAECATFGFSGWWQAENHARRQRDVAHTLMATCLIAERVSVSTEDVENLHFWSPKLAEAHFQPLALR